MDFCLVSGFISLLIVMIGVASKNIIEEAWFDGRLSKSESIIVWIIVNSHYFMMISKVIIFGVFFIYLMVSLPNVEFSDKFSPTYCSRQIFLTSLVLSTLFLISGRVTNIRSFIKIFYSSKARYASM